MDDKPQNPSDGVIDYELDARGNAPPHSLDSHSPIADTPRLDPGRLANGQFAPGHIAAQYARPNDIQPPEVEAAIREYVANGGYWCHACAKIGRSHNKVKKAMEKLPHLLDMFETAKQGFVELFEQECDRRATVGIRKLVASAGKIVGEERVYSDNLLQFRLRAMAPEKYDPARNVGNSTGGARTGLLLVPVHPSSEEWEELNRRHHERLLAPKPDEVAKLPAPTPRAGVSTQAGSAPGGNLHKRPITIDG